MTSMAENQDEDQIFNDDMKCILALYCAKTTTDLNELKGLSL